MSRAGMYFFAMVTTYTEVFAPIFAIDASTKWEKEKNTCSNACL